MFDGLVDAYTIRARWAPAFVVALPVALAVGIWLPGEPVWPQALGGGLVLLAVMTLVEQGIRDVGKRKEPVLYRWWGGKPTTRMLRHRDDALPAPLKAQIRAKLATLVPGVSIPTPAQEAGDPAGADAVYETVVAALREHTRDAKLYRLVRAENIAYGFRRNLWGMKLWGILAAIGGLVACGVNAWTPYRGGTVAPLPLLPTAVSACLLLIWVFAITPSWVRRAADTYAIRLLETALRLP